MVATERAFDQQIGKTLQWEGGYVDDPADPGGETNFGISKRAYPDLDIQGLTRDAAIAIYRRDYWDKPGWAQLPDVLAAKGFDLGVNMGQRTAVKLVQRALNQCGWRPLLAIDGGLGALTAAAASGLDPALVLQTLRGEARNHYVALATEHPALRRFLHGWLRRAAA